MLQRLLALSLALLTPSALIAADAAASLDGQTKPRWEAGIAVGGATLPQYMGSNERYTLAAPIPYIIYRGDKLKVDRSGIRRELFGINNLTADLSLGVGMPVRNSNVARSGMPELRFALQLGPRLNIHLLDSEAKSVTLRLPLRAAFSISGKAIGWLAEPDLLVEYKPTAEIKLSFAGGLLYGSADYMRYYYGVDPIYATAIRPAYSARQGLHSLSLRTAITYEISDDLTFFTTLRYRNLAPGAIADSPLVKDRNYISIAGGIAWSFWSSEEQVTVE